MSYQRSKNLDKWLGRYSYERGATIVNSGTGERSYQKTMKRMHSLWAVHYFKLRRLGYSKAMAATCANYLNIRYSRNKVYENESLFRNKRTIK